MRDEEPIGTSAEIEARDQPQDTGGGLSWGTKLKIAAVVLAVAGFVWLGVSKASRRSVSLVNGTNVAYSVEVSGQNHELKPYEHRRIRLGEGKHTFRILPPADSPAAAGETPADAGAGLPGESHDFELTGGFFGRLFGDTAPVLNPDGAAVLFVETASYGNAAMRDDELLPPAFYAEVPDVQDRFQDPPTSTEVGIGGGETRRVLRVLRENDFKQLHGILAANFGDAAADTFVVRRYMLEGGGHGKSVHGMLLSGEPVTPPPVTPDPRREPDRYVAPFDAAAASAEADARVEQMRAERDAAFTGGRPKLIAPKPHPASVMRGGGDAEQADADDAAADDGG